ncbi:MAG: hypothetical protein ABF718_04545 [Leuconostoc pseudomesenteroides]|uniref:hypothetical protein n=1 Tax=Leuconostoc pseudomesenteroides TaxID=33968 RepID=UPI0039E75C09
MITNFLEKVINFIAVAVIITIMLVAIFRQSYGPTLSPLTIVFCALLLVLLGLLLFFNLNTISKKLKKFLWYSVLLVLFTLQLFVVFRTYNVPFTDTGYIFIQAQNLSFGSLQWDRYFEVYPNNVNITILWGCVFRIFHFFHLRNDLLAAYILQLFILDSAILFLYHIVKSKINKNLANILIVSMLLYFPLTMFTVWVYNDSLSTSFMIFVIGLLVLFWHNPTKMRYIYFVSAATLLAITFLIRQNVIVIAIALVLTIILAKQRWKEKIVQVLVIVAIFCSFSVLSNSVQSLQKYYPDKNTAVPALSWINMGLNNETSGEVHGADPFLFEQKGRTSQEKNKLYLQSIKQRLSMYSLSSLAEHFLKKVVYMYGTGLTVQDFFYWFTRDNNSPAILGKFGPIIVNFFQILYVVIYFVTACFMLKRFKSINNENPIILFCVLSFLGVFAFQVGLWEVRDRYGLIAVPFLIFIFAVSVSRINYRKVVQGIRKCILGKEYVFAILGLGIIIFTYLLDFQYTTTTSTLQQFSLNQPFTLYEGGNEVKFLPKQKYQITFDVKKKNNIGSFNNLAYAHKENFTSPNPNYKDRTLLSLSLLRIDNNKKVVIESDSGRTKNVLSKGRYRLTITNKSQKTVYSRTLINIGKADFSFNPLYQSVKDFKYLMPNMQIYSESSSLLFPPKQYKLIFVVIVFSYVLVIFLLISKSKTNKSKLSY